ncbi:MAG: FAD-binding protein [Chloroflexi bacterium]|nr:FAD-binding protein [Chloroflexota bacterium]
MMLIQPKSVSEVQTAVKSTPQICIRGGGSKPGLFSPVDGVTLLDMRGLSGILAYEPDEYTLTAYAGTAVSTITNELAKHGQYLPFDPIFVQQGATLGGTVAANTSGSGRYRYGGVRDFILGVSFVDGNGQLVRGGGKVVKNSAGFDLPKFMVGSLGQYGVLVVVTFKLFPQPRAYVTMRVTYANLNGVLQALYKLAVMPFEMDAVDIEVEHSSLVIRLGGLVAALPGRVARLRDFLQQETGGETAVLLKTNDDVTHWQTQNSFDWVPDGQSLVKIPITPKKISTLDEQLSIHSRRYTVGGNVAWVALDDVSQLHPILEMLNLTGLQLTGRTTNPIIGTLRGQSFAQRIKKAVDPTGKFPITNHRLTTND